MRIEKNQSLSKLTTFRMGGNCKEIIYPQSKEDLLIIWEQKPDAFRYIISGGSNIIINDNKQFNRVISLKELNNAINYRGNGRYYVGSSVRLQKLIKQINTDGYGGIEYLYSVPAMLGGAIFMNAGLGAKYNKSISDNIVYVDLFKNGEFFRANKEDCEFAYRNSRFQKESGTVILGAELQFLPIELNEAQKIINTRMKHVMEVQDREYPNIGSLFSVSNSKIMNGLMKLHIGFPNNGVCFSAKKNNWILNKGNGTFRQVRLLINIAKFVHTISFKPCRLEAKLWR